jgi:phosphodiesterase/alkaline phosphatase D-like protein
MAYKRRTYIAYSATVNTATEINLETIYNASKTGDEKISDGTLSGTVGFKSITFWYDQDTKVKMNGVSETYNDFILFKKVNNQITQNTIGPCKEVIFRNDSGSSLTLSVYAVLNKSNLTIQ